MKKVATRRSIALLLALAASAAACGGGGGGSLELGIKRVALSLSFSEEELAVAVPPIVIQRLVPAPPGIDLAAPMPPAPFVPPDLASLLPTCPEAPPGAPPVIPVARTVNAPPAVGAYLRRNQGTITINGAIPIALPYPPFSQWEIPTIEEVDRPATEGVPFIVDPLPAGKDYILDLRKVIIGDFIVTDRIQITATDIKLLKRTTSAAGQETVFVPDPPIVLYAFGTEGTEWRSAGVDTETNTSMLLQGKIVAREVVDVCGEPIDTYRVEVRETMVNLDTGDVSGNDPSGDPTFLNYAPQFGGMVVREDVLSTIATRDPSTGVPVRATLDYVSTTSSVEPSGQL